MWGRPFYAMARRAQHLMIRKVCVEESERLVHALFLFCEEAWPIEPTGNHELDQ